MVPRRPLPDLCLIAIFQLQTPNDQLKASKMSPRCAVLMRAANRQVKALVISGEFYIALNNRLINSLLFASQPSMKQLKNAGESFPDYPMAITHLSKWNCLHLSYYETLEQSDIDHIADIFSAVTDLKFIYESNNKNLVALLQHPQWANQLINLMVVDSGEYSRFNSTQSTNFYIAVNKLSALKCLAIKMRDGTMPNMPVFNKLKVILVEFHLNIEHFLYSLERNAFNNVDLQVHLLTNDIGKVLHLSEPVRRLIVRLGKRQFSYSSAIVLPLCDQLSALTSLDVIIHSTEVVALFTSLTQLSQLVHLFLNVDFDVIFPNEQPLPPLTVQLTSVRAVDLHLRITAHSEVKWLNLQWTMPNLQVINLQNIHCTSCDIRLINYLRDEYNEYSTPSSYAAVKCLRATFTRLHSTLPHGQIILGQNEPCPSLEQLALLAGQ